MEPLSEALSLMRSHTSALHMMEAGGAWGVSFGQYEGLKFNAMLRGHCWLRVEGEPTPWFFGEGDCFLLTKGKPFALLSGPEETPAPFQEALRLDPDGIARCGTGKESYLVGGRFHFERGETCPLLSSLPAVVPVRAHSSEADVLRWSLDQFDRELRSRQPGKELAVDHLAHLMLIQVFRLYARSLDLEDATQRGWLVALRDPQLREVLSAVHGDIPRRWTLETMSRVAGMSRSSFAARFKFVVGRSPLEYLTGWRMHVAADRLRSTERNVGTIANEVGYESEAAFSTAFKKVHGRSPRAHRMAAVTA
ncbi:AraC family transcriptional regulator [Terriglobus sp.]|uniref:AraC family transcriptional regulator n=1 Tax=Terriglobus sp. TaxID=1889013 RepID=UPI003B002AEB